MRRSAGSPPDDAWTGGGRTDRVRPGCPAGSEARLKFAATDWVAKRVAIEGLSWFTDDQAYRAMDFLLDALDEIAGEIFGSVAHLLNLDLDLIFVDTTSTYWELDGADQLADLQDIVDDDGVSRPAEQGKRAFGHSKDFRTDLPQVVIAMAVTREACRCGAGPSPATPPTPPSSGPSRTTWSAGTCTGWSGSPTAASPLRRPPGLPDPRRWALHPRREAPQHQQ